jgi:hypothetical protein
MNQSASNKLQINPPKLPPLYPKQKLAIESTARYTLIEASTKAGKTAGCLMWLLMQAWNSKGDNRNFWWIAPVDAQAKIAFRRLKRMLRQSDPDHIAWNTNETEKRVELFNGASIWFKGSDDPDNLYGDDVYAAVIDEATRCKDEAWHAIRSTLTATKGPVKIIGNVRGKRNWAYQLARKAQAGAPNMAYFKLTALDAVEGGILDQSEVDDARATLPDHVFRQLYLAEPADDGGNPFGLDYIVKCTRDGLASGPAVCYGVDLAKSYDWTVVIGLNENGEVCTADRWQSSWEFTKERILRVVGQKPVLIDSTGVGDPIVEALALKSNAKGFRFSSNSKQQLMEGLAVAIQQGKVWYPRGGWLQAELEAFEYEHTRNTVKYSAPAGMHDDGVCALALAVQCSWSRRTLTAHAGQIYAPSQAQIAVLKVEVQRRRMEGSGVNASDRRFGSLSTVKRVRLNLPN